MISFRAQGTIEYLVIIAVVVAISLVLVSISSTLFGSPASEINSSTASIGSNMGAGGIGVFDSAVDSGGDGIISLQNNSGGVITLSKISSGGVDNTFRDSVYSGGKKSFYVNNLGAACPCAPGQTKRNCQLSFTYTTASGLTKTAVVNVPVDCVEQLNLRDVSVSRQYVVDVNAPVVSLLSPADNNSTSDGLVDFSFSVSDNNAISRCELLINGADVNTIYDVDTNASNSIDYNLALLGYGYFGWDVNCVDFGGNWDSQGVDWNLEYYEAGSYRGGCNNRAAGGYFFNGSGTLSDPFGVCDCVMLQDMNNFLDANYALLDDIDCSDSVTWSSGAGFSPVGNGSDYFTGSFDGAGFSVSDLFINRPSSLYVGLFGYAFGAKISDVGLIDVNVRGSSFVGGLAGNIGASLVSGSFSSGRVYGSDADVGGLIGRSVSSSSVSDSYSSSVVSGNGALGGLLGYNGEASTVSACSSSGSVSGNSYVGGLVGSNVGSSIISDSYSSSVVSGVSNYVGGLLGYNSSSTVSACFANGSVSGSTYVGGLVGSNDGATVSACFSSGSVSGSSSVGGLVGYNPYSTVNNSFWDVARTTKEVCCGASSHSVCNCVGKNVGGADSNAWYPMLTGSFVGDYNVPMQHNIESSYDWDFDDVWLNVSGNYPSLQ